jgi:hypothetical protein
MLLLRSDVVKLVHYNEFSPFPFLTVFRRFLTRSRVFRPLAVDRKLSNYMSLCIKSVAGFFITLLGILKDMVLNTC